jgi:acetyl esterase/lipase
MLTFTVDLWEGYGYRGDLEDGFRPSLDAYILESEKPRPAALILPGSGYMQCSPREAEALAIHFNAEGFHAFVLWYSCDPRRHPVPILDCARAFTLIRERHAEWVLDPGKIVLMGFSAGAHLALSTLLFASRDFAVSPGINPRYTGAQALVLGYPVITSGEFAHQGSFNCLLGEAPDPALVDLLSLENQITGELPPVFLWHTYTDTSVPVENSFLLAGALRRAGVSLEMHIFPDGKHGMSLAIDETSAGDREYINPHVAQWFPLCVNWLKLRF